MTLAPSPSPTPMGAEKERGETSRPSPLSGFCDACGKPFPVRQLNLVFATHNARYGEGPNSREWSGDAAFALICGPCFVDGIS